MAILAASRSDASKCFFRPGRDDTQVLQEWLHRNLNPRRWSSLIGTTPPAGPEAALQDHRVVPASDWVSMRVYPYLAPIDKST